MEEEVDEEDEEVDEEDEDEDVPFCKTDFSLNNSNRVGVVDVVALAAPVIGVNGWATVVDLSSDSVMGAPDAFCSR